VTKDPEGTDATMSISKNKVACVTGGARGIGAAIAKTLAAEGFDVAILDVLDATETVAAIEELGPRGLAVSCDITSADARAAALDTIQHELGRLDILVNNAGVAPNVRADLLDAGEESYDRVMGINLKGPYFLTQAVANWMVAQKSERPDEFLAIVNISSISAYTASPPRGEYCLSKAGISMMTKLYAARLADEGIGVYEIRPGIIATDMTSTVKDKYDKLILEEGITPIRRWGQPEDIAQAVAACARGNFKFSTGEVINVDGGFHLRTL
jgi:3-oxoacyl-[acyl-carrier protein] reductase